MAANALSPAGRCTPPKKFQKTGLHEVVNILILIGRILPGGAALSCVAPLPV